MLKNEKNVELARKIIAELPEQLAPQLGSAENEKGQLKLFPMPKYSKLQRMDIQLITEIIKRKFGGDYVSEGTDRFYWLLPIPDVPLPTSPLDKTEQNIKNVQNVGATQNAFGDQTTPAAASPAPAAEPAPNDANTEKPKEAPPQQPSPLKVFQERYCSTCDDQSEGCTPENSTGREKMQRCFNVLQLLFLGDIRENLLKLKPFNRYPPGGRSGSHSQSSQPNSQPQQQKPKSFFLENGIVWAKSETGSGKPCDKAYEAKNRKDGALSAEYAKLADAVTKKKGFDGYYFYIVDGQNAYIGRIKTEKEAEKK